MLVATLFRHYQEFIEIMSQHPEGLYQDNTRHPLVNSVNKALTLARVSKDTFNLWCSKEVNDGFGIRNFMTLPIDHLPPDIIRDATADPHSLSD